MKKLFLTLLAIGGLVACNTTIEEIGFNTGNEAFDSLQPMEEIDDEAVVSIITGAVKIADCITWIETKNDWEGLREQVAGAVGNPTGLIFNEDMSYGSLVCTPENGSSVQEQRVISRNYYYLTSTYRYDSAEDTLYTLNPETGEECAAKVEYCKKGVLVLDGTIYTTNTPTPKSLNNGRHKIKLRRTNESESVKMLTIVERALDPNIEVEELIARQKEPINDELVTKSLTEKGFWFLLETVYDTEQERWIDKRDVDDAKYIATMFTESELNCLIMGGVITATYRYDIDSNMLYTTNSESGKEYSAEVLFCDSEYMVLDGQIAIYDKELATNGEQRYRMICYLHESAKGVVESYLNATEKAE